jgi:serine/threonine protein kinase
MRPAMALPILKGMTIQGSRGTYFVEDMLCEGGMGRLFIAKSPQGTKVVVKEPKILGDCDDPVRLEKLKVEAQILQNINHRNIVKYVDSRDEGHTFYLIIEFVSGKSMKDLYWKRPAEEYEARQYTLTLLYALNYIHNLNIIHRDINPKNLLLPKDLVIIDFGAAKHGYTQLLTFGQTVVGTPGWSAPEQFSGLVTPRCDIYSVGATLFFLLTGHPPQTYIRSDGTVESPKKVNPRVSSEMASVVLKAMDIDPSKRFQIADDMIQEIEGRRVLREPPCIFCRGRKHQIDRTLSIGRLPQCDIYIDDPQLYVSRTHAEVFMDSGTYWIEDTGSKNGTFIYRNGMFQRIMKSELRDGDLIALCYKSDKGPYITLNFKKGNA